MKGILPTSALVGGVPFAWAAHVTSCCASLSLSGLRVIYPGSAAYNASESSYFATNVELGPSCIVQPLSSHDVSLAVTSLAKTSSICQFAIRSGGHATWAGANDISAPGVTIDLRLMNSTTYNSNNSTATILPGARWESVYETLDALNVAVPGGRAGPVGVGGLTIGGGNSFFSSRYGYVCDNVANFEVVLANGSIVEANNKTNSDLFTALKGGSGNFGIVTKIELEAFPNTNLWGGAVTYDNSTTPQIISGIVNFTNNVINQPYASLITYWEYNSTTDANFVLNAFEYTEPVVSPPAYDDFYKIPNTSDTMQITNLYNLTVTLAQTAGYRDLFLTLTFKNNADVMQKAIDLHNAFIEQLKAGVSSDYWTVVTMFQPLPAIFSVHSQERGGNVLGLDRFLDENLLLFLFDLSWDDTSDDALFRQVGDSMVDQLTAYAEGIGAGNPYVYLNYADKTQNPLASYGPQNVDYIRKVARKYDPSGVFQTDVPGGFKISRV